MQLQLPYNTIVLPIIKWFLILSPTYNKKTCLLKDSYELFTTFKENDRVLLGHKIQGKIVVPFTFIETPKCAAQVKGRPCRFKAKSGTPYCGHHKKYRCIQMYEPPSHENHVATIIIIQRFFHRIFLEKLNRQEMRTMDIFGITQWNTCSKNIILMTCDGLKEWWLVDKIAEILTNQLNASTNENPVIKYPSSPFTRMPYDNESLERLLLRYSISELAKNPPLNIFLRKCIGVKKDVRYDQYNQYLRYQYIQYVDSMDNFTGRWILKSQKWTSF